MTVQVLILLSFAGTLVAVGEVVVEFLTISGSAAPSYFTTTVQLAILAAWMFTHFFLWRFGDYSQLAVRTPEPTVDELVGTMDKRKLVTILIPAYKEPVEVLTRSLYSIVFQNYPRKNLVLLIDNPSDQMEGEIALIRRISDELKQLDESLDRTQDCGDDAGVLSEYLKMDHYIQGVIESLNQMPNESNQKRIFQFLDDYRAHLADRRISIEDSRGEVHHHPADIAAMLEPLRRITRTQVSSFNRKAWRNLSRNPTKADNINSFLNLLGKPIRETKQGELLVDFVRGRVVFPRTEYISILDADTNVAPDYVINLVSIMERGENNTVAIGQSICQYEYDPGNQIARNSAAEIDLGSLMLRGFASQDLMFWWGTNCIARMDLLEEVAIRDSEMKKFIHDRTVTEDAETSVALWKRGFEIMTYPEIMAWSLGPKDIGSLVSQRERWSLGFIIHMFSLVRGNARKRLRRAMVFAGLANVAFLFLSSFLATRAIQELPILSVVPGLTSLGLIGFYLHKLGYGASRLFHFLGQGLLVAPAYLMGALKTFFQMMTGYRFPYVRTSRVAGVIQVKKVYQLAYGLITLHLCWGMLGQWGPDAIQQSVQGIVLGSLLYLAYCDSGQKKHGVSAKNSLASLRNR
jgi:cellulose synthase/poly-beta-1,6-N-acetylglucosamine synthase-like glycosyltransferase